jgi:hypothetical protein
LRCLALAANVCACDGRGINDPRPVPDENVNKKPEGNEDTETPAWHKHFVGGCQTILKSICEAIDLMSVGEKENVLRHHVPNECNQSVGRYFTVSLERGEIAHKILMKYILQKHLSQDCILRHCLEN